MDANDPAHANRRKHPRFAIDVPARLTLMGLTIEGRLVDVSQRGACFFTADVTLRAQDCNFVQVEFDLPVAGATRNVQFYVRVAHVSPAEVDGKPGRRIGLELESDLLLDDVEL